MNAIKVQAPSCQLSPAVAVEYIHKLPHFSLSDILTEAIY